jgi:hypothetical protein
MIGRSTWMILLIEEASMSICALVEPGEKRVGAAGDPVVEAGADVDHQIAAVHRHVGLVEPVHAEHADPVLARGRVGAEAHQRRGDRKARGLDQLAQELAGAGAQS